LKPNPEGRPATEEDPGCSSATEARYCKTLAQEGSESQAELARHKQNQTTMERRNTPNAKQALNNLSGQTHKHPSKSNTNETKQNETTTSKQL
jgi:hypothetical protein